MSPPVTHRFSSHVTTAHVTFISNLENYGKEEKQIAGNVPVNEQNNYGNAAKTDLQEIEQHFLCAIEQTNRFK